MRSLRWVLMFAVLLQKYANTTSIAEEINFEVSYMRDSAKNDPQQAAYTLPESVENEPEEPATDEHAEDVETSQSEIVETHALPEEMANPEEMNAQAKRPRRRRRRRRRKRPKPTASPDELDTYYTLPEEEIKRKPNKYRPQDETEEPPPESSTVPRRRNSKRRRRPLKRPPATVEDYPATAEGSIDAPSDNTNNTDEPHHPDTPAAVAEQLEEEPSRNTKVASAAEAGANSELYPVKPQLPMTARKMQAKKENEPFYAVFKDLAPKVHHPKESDFTKPPVRDEFSRKPQEHVIIDEEVRDDADYTRLNTADGSKSKSKEASVPPDNIRKDTESPKEDPATNVRRRKRPPHLLKGEQQPEPVKSEPLFEPKVAESVDAKNQVQAIRKNEVKIDDEVKSNLVEQRKFKIDERVKQNDTNKKDVFKLRRLPPISAILRHAKNRPKNETTTTPPPSGHKGLPPKSDVSKIKESISNEILTHAATLDQLNQRMGTNITDDGDEEEEPAEPAVVAAPSPSTARSVEKTELAASHSTSRPAPTTSSTHRPAAHARNQNFEFPIITYTEQKQRYSTTSAIPTTISSKGTTTESTAFIYIPCNHTITEVFRSTFNFSNNGNATKHVDSANSAEKVGQYQPTTTATTTTTTITTTSTSTISTPTSKATPTVDRESTNLFDTTAIKQLEKLLQAEMDTVSATVETVNQTKIAKNTTQVGTLLQHLDTSALESELNYLFQNGGTPPTIRKEVKSSTDANFREPKWFHESSKHRQVHQQQPNEDRASNDYNNKDIIISYTSTIPQISFNDIDPQQELFQGNELSLHLRNNSYRRVPTDSTILHKNKNHNERKKLPLAVKSAIIISGAILALAVLGFFALLLSCKIRQAKSRMKCHRELYRERFQNSEFRQSSRSTSPVVSKSNYNARNFPNNIQSNVASNRNYYLWQTLRKTFQYD